MYGVKSSDISSSLSSNLDLVKASITKGSLSLSVLSL